MRRWQPSNGTEGMMFVGEFCEHCIREKFMNTQKHGDMQCEILNNSLLNERPCFDKDLKFDGWEWFSSEDFTMHKCNQYKDWDWDKGDPPPSVPYDPNQLVMPFMSEQVENILTKDKVLEYPE